MKRKLTLVLVDDDALLLRVLVRGVGDRVDILTAGNAAAARAVLEGAVREGAVLKGGQAVDVVVADFCMPDGSGLDLLTWVKTHHPRVGRVLISGTAELLKADQLLRMEQAHAVLGKPFTIDELLAVVASVAPFSEV
jgi:DNA-binding NtrC family response regulator